MSLLSITSIKAWLSGLPGSRTRALAMALAIAGAISGLATYAAFTQAPPFGDDPNTVFWLLNVDLVILLLLVTIVARLAVSLWSRRRRGIAGARLHVRLVFIFSLLTAIPAILMTIFAAVFLHYGVQSWFSDRVKTAVEESQAVAEAYLEEHQQVIKADILAMANDIDRQATTLIDDAAYFNRSMDTQSFLRNFSEAIVFDSSGRVLAGSGLSYTLGMETLPQYALPQADEGDVVVMTGESEDRVRALVRLNNFVDAYLFVGRMVDPVVLSHLADTKKAAEEYQRLESQRGHLQVKMTMIFIIVALLLMFAAIWAGLVLARQMIEPIAELIAAAEKVRSGDLTARVEESERQGEFEVLARAFNRMTKQLQEQQKDLVVAARQAAWSDVARRIAHEIKNPLTPIQLSAERLKRKYLKQIHDDPETFSRCTDTIIQHVGDIGRMVGEFAAFARMPEAVLRRGTVNGDIGDLVALQQQAHPEITFTTTGLNVGAETMVDSAQFRQAFTNIIQNAIDTVENADMKKIGVALLMHEGEIAVVVADSGAGFPAGDDEKARLTEPYVTHKPRGTGLGLAIVRKIMEDHGGVLILGAPDWLKGEAMVLQNGGAVVVLTLPIFLGATKGALVA
jgi:nitrogen fixation/metabolism regulation signal transduction histidine kinase